MKIMRLAILLASGMHALDVLQSDWSLPDFGNVTNAGSYTDDPRPSSPHAKARLYVQRGCHKNTFSARYNEYLGAVESFPGM